MMYSYMVQFWYVDSQKEQPDYQFQLSVSQPYSDEFVLGLAFLGARCHSVVCATYSAGSGKTRILGSVRLSDLSSFCTLF